MQLSPVSNIRAGELRPLLHFAAVFGLLGAGLAIGKGVANTLFLSRLGVGYLPWVYLGQAVLLSLASLAYAAVADRHPPERVLRALLAAMAALVALAWLLIRTRAHGVAYPAIYLIAETASEILVLHATLYFGRWFDAAQCKRLLAQALAGFQLGELAGGLILASLAGVLGIANLVWLWVASAALALLLLSRWHATQGASPPVFGRRRHGGGWRLALAEVGEGWSFARRSSLLWNSSVAVLFTVIAVYLLSFLAKSVYAETFRTEEELAIVFGMISFIGGTCAVLAQSFLVPGLMSRHGVRRMNLAYPVTTALAAASLLGPFPVAAALTASFNRRVLLPAVRNPSRNMLFHALPDYMQGRARALSLAVVLPCAMALAGAASGMLGFGQIAAAALVAALLYWAFSVRTNRAYVDALMTTLRERLYVPRGALGHPPLGRDRAVFERLAEGVRRTEPAVVLAHARLLAESFGERGASPLLERARAASPMLRDQLVRIAAPVVTHAHYGALLELLEDADAHQQATVLGVLFGGRARAALERIPALLASPNPRLTACGIVGALGCGVGALRTGARLRLDEMLASDEPDRLIPALEAATEVEHAVEGGRIRSLLGHAEPRVARAACRVVRAGRVAGGAVPWDALEALACAHGDAMTRGEALRCFHAAPEEHRQRVLLRAFDDPRPELAAEATDVLSLAPRAAGRMLQAAERGELGPRGALRVAQALAGMAGHAKECRALALVKLEQAERFGEALAALPREEASARARILALVLEERRAQALEAALAALSRGPTEPSARLMAAALRARNPRYLAACAEFLDAWPDRVIAEAVRRALDDLLRPPTTGVARGWPECAGRLEAFADPWLRTCLGSAPA